MHGQFGPQDLISLPLCVHFSDLPLVHCFAVAELTERRPLLLQQQIEQQWLCVMQVEAPWPQQFEAERGGPGQAHH